LSSRRGALFALALVALLVRLPPLVRFGGVELGIYDARDYDSIAASLVEDGVFALRGDLGSQRPPLYPALVAVVYRFAGVHDWQAVRLLQIALNVAIVPVVYALGRRLYDGRTGFLAAVLAVFYPSLWGHDYLILTEVLFTLLLCAGTLCLVEHAARPRATVMAGAGLLLGLAALTRSSLFLYPPLLALAVFGWSREPRVRRIAAVAVFVAAFALAVGPWIARNTRLHGRISPIDSYSANTAARYSPMAAVERAVVDAGDRSEASPWVDWPAPVRWARWIAHHALEFWRIDREVAGAASRQFLGPMTRPALFVLAAIVAGYYVALLLAAVFGLVLRPPSDRLQLALVLSVVAGLWGVHAATIGHSRYHLPLMPLMAIFAARLVVARGQAVRRRRVVAAAALATVLVGSWLANFLGEDRGDLVRRLRRVDEAQDRRDGRGSGGDG
jgi:4-amino-4-deoxy-L-arabinose transferase-like glycosyltransferase